MSAAARPVVPAGKAAVDFLAAELRRRPPRCGAVRIVALDGRAGAGKTTLAGPLAARLDAPVVALEDLYGGWAGLEDGVERLRTDVLEPLAAGRAAAVPAYDWWRGRWDAPHRLEPPPLLVVEGVGAGAAAVREHVALLAWVELGEDERRERALARDGGVFAPHWDGWAAQEDRLLARDRAPEHADVVVDEAA